MTQTMVREDWWRQAACEGSRNPEIFFPGPTPRENTVNKARRVCRGCPVHTDCLNEALRREQARPSKSHRFGVWGGASPAQRAQIHLCRTGTCEHADPSLCMLEVRP